MKKLTSSCVLNVGVLLVFGAIAPRGAKAWGHLGHQTIAQIGSQLVQVDGNFWANNETQMGVLTNVPDAVWKSGPTGVNEKPTHWFQIDSYFSDPLQYPLFPQIYSDAIKKYTEPTLIVNGTAPWRIYQMYQIAVAALKRKDFTTGLQMAGTMSHYIGDLSQPLHVSKNYDGQETGDPGIHAFYETKNIQAANVTELTNDVTDRAKKLLKDPSFLAQFDGSIVESAFKEISRSIAAKDSLISIDLHLGRGAQGSAALLEHAKDRMADGAASLAIILERLSHDAGLGNSGASIHVATPNWVAPLYNAAKKKKAFYHSDVNDLIQFLDGGDCDE